MAEMRNHGWKYLSKPFFHIGLGVGLDPSEPLAYCLRAPMFMVTTSRIFRPPLY